MGRPRTLRPQLRRDSLGGCGPVTRLLSQRHPRLTASQPRASMFKVGIPPEVTCSGAC